MTLESLREAHVRTAHRHGAVAGGELIALAAGGARSWAERELHRRMHVGGVTGWTANREIVLLGFGRAIGDVVFEQEKVIVEVDGWAYHRDLRAFHRDDPQAFLARLRATLRARS